MSFSVATIAQRTGLKHRRLRYILDHQLVPGLEPIRAGHGNARHLDSFQAFVLAVAAALLEYGYPRTCIKRLMEALHGASSSRKKLSLDQIYRSCRQELTIGNTEAFKLDEDWFVLPTLKRKKDYQPVLLTVVKLERIRYMLGGCDGSAETQSGDRDSCRPALRT